MAEDIVPSKAEAGRIFGWYKELSRGERRALWACFGGWGLDGMDVKLYGYVIPTLIAAWGMSRGQAGSIATIALMSSAIGGWGGGALADRYGRVRVLQISILWYSLLTFLCAFANNFTEMFSLRVIQGLGFGAEWGVGVALIGEIIRDKYRGTATGSVHSAWAVGGALAAGFYGLLFSLFPADIAWRVLFGIGALPALLVLYIRRHVEDSAIYLKTKGRSASKATVFAQIFSARYAYKTVLGCMICTGCLGGAYAVQTWLPTYLNSVRHLNVVKTSSFIVMFEVAHFFGYIAGAYAADLIGRRANFILTSLATAIIVGIYTFVPVSNLVTFFLGIPLGFFASATYSGIGAILNEMYPTRMRGSGIGFCYNFGRGIGALFPTVVGFLSARMPLGQTIGVLTVGAYGLVVIGALLLPESSDRSLPE